MFATHFLHFISFVSLSQYIYVCVWCWAKDSVRCVVLYFCVAFLLWVDVWREQVALLKLCVMHKTHILDTICFDFQHGNRTSDADIYNELKIRTASVLTRCALLLICPFGFFFLFPLFSVIHMCFEIFARISKKWIFCRKMPQQGWKSK